MWRSPRLLDEGRADVNGQIDPAVDELVKQAELRLVGGQHHVHLRVGGLKAVDRVVQRPTGGQPGRANGQAALYRLFRHLLLRPVDDRNRDLDAVVEDPSGVGQRRLFGGAVEELDVQLALQ